MTKFQRYTLFKNYLIYLLIYLFWFKVPLLSPLKISENPRSSENISASLPPPYLSNFAKCEQTRIFQTNYWSRQLICDLKTLQISITNIANISDFSQGKVKTCLAGRHKMFPLISSFLIEIVHSYIIGKSIHSIVR